ncbi:MAG TPA: alpha-amylase family glycosyl hydrolase [Spirochaetia bacterium]|nr:alpha-amylase family glycosyl hydrolase [Spirochaetia bacterium]
MADDTVQALRGASIYQVFVRNQSEEGTFEAALPALDKAKELGFDYVYLTPIHPVGAAARKGSLGSPYAIADYRAVDPALGGEEGFRRFLDAAHAKDLRVVMDVVYNHTSPDSVLARERPDWFWKGPEGRPTPRVADWSDVVDLDYGRSGLRDYQIETLEAWFRFGVDGFRCDVASLVPVPFWLEARRRLALAAAAAGREPCLWLAESVHKEFVAELRARGLYAASDAELHSAFDLSYDYDGRPELEAAWAGRKPLSAYLHHLFLQDCMLPQEAVKLRFLENHDQPRAASLFGRGARLRSWTLFAMLLPGAFLAYAGEESAITRRPSLFDRDPVDWASGDAAFEAWFGKAHQATKALRAAAPRFSARELAAGLVLLERSGEGRRAAALLNLDGRAGQVALPGPIAGAELLSGARVSLAGTVEIPEEPLLVELGL